MHILSFDIEHWYESWRLRGLGGYENLPDCDSALVERLLDALEAADQRATFFFTGSFAREFPATARACAERGHEVASHSDQHTLLPCFASFHELKEDLLRSLDGISQATGRRVLGFRAPKWSLTPGLETAVLEILAEQGLTYDSSFFPAFWNSGTRRMTPHAMRLPSGARIAEVPATALRMGSLALPCGGAYFRLLPLAATRRMLAQCSSRGAPGLLYLHPYDLNPRCHFVSGGGLLFKWMRTVGVGTAFSKLEQLLKTMRFTRIDRWLEQHGRDLPELSALPESGPARRHDKTPLPR